MQGADESGSASASFACLHDALEGRIGHAVGDISAIGGVHQLDVLSCQTDVREPRFEAQFADSSGIESDAPGARFQSRQIMFTSVLCARARWAQQRERALGLDQEVDVAERVPLVVCGIRKVT